MAFNPLNPLHAIRCRFLCTNLFKRFKHQTFLDQSASDNLKNSSFSSSTLNETQNFNFDQKLLHKFYLIILVFDRKNATTEALTIVD